MKEIEIFYNSNGTLQSRINPNLVFDGENNSVIITASFPEEAENWDKYAYISAGGEIGFFELGNSNPAEFTVPGEYLTEGKCTVGFEVRYGETVVRFEPIELFVSGFINETEKIDRSIKFADLFGKLDFDTSSKILKAVTKDGKKMGGEIRLGDYFLSDVTVPTKTSELINDSGFLTEHQSLANYALKSELPTKTSDLINDSGFLTSHQDLTNYVTMQYLFGNYYDKTYIDNALGSVSTALGGVVNGNF